MNCYDIMYMDMELINMTTIYFMRHSEPLKYNNVK